MPTFERWLSQATDGGARCYLCCASPASSAIDLSTRQRAVGLQSRLLRRGRRERLSVRPRLTPRSSLSHFAIPRAMSGDSTRMRIFTTALRTSETLFALGVTRM
jgi:hypothetical protein